MREFFGRLTESLANRAMPQNSDKLTGVQLVDILERRQILDHDGSIDLQRIDLLLSQA